MNDSTTKNRKTMASDTPLKRLIRRIEREIKRCTYLGDIAVNDEEYALLISYFQDFFRIGRRDKKTQRNATVAVALVQIGIRSYDRKFWPHISDVLNVASVNQYERVWIGDCFYATLLKYNKFHVEQSETMNNVLLHCFITEEYADELFDFLFAYYQIDLDRDLSHNSKEMRERLMSAMSKGENTKRAHKIKRHTADAVLANMHGCKIRVARILRFMDDALFEGKLPTDSPNRVAKLFVEWTRHSTYFNREKKSVSGLTRRGLKRFSSPYIHFDTRASVFEFIMPSQIIELSEDEEMPLISWELTWQGCEPVHMPVDAKSSVTGCKTEKTKYVLTPQELFPGCKLRILKNGTEPCRIFNNPADSVRFFDAEYDMVSSDSLRAGDLFAFCAKDAPIDSQAIYGKESVLGLDLFSLQVQTGDVIRRADESLLCVGKALEEGILSRGFVEGAFDISEDERTIIYSEAPSVYFRMPREKENGLCIYINDVPHRYDPLACPHFVDKTRPQDLGYILFTDRYITEPGRYSVQIDIPNSRKRLSCRFTYIPGFRFAYLDAPYIFKTTGRVSFAPELYVRPRDNSICATENGYDFVIDPDIEKLHFIVRTGNQDRVIELDPPVLRWRSDQEPWQTWQTVPSEPIWHKEFPGTIYLKYPVQQAEFSMPPLISADMSNSGEDQEFSAVFNKNAETGEIVCDTRKMLAWFGNETPIRKLYLSLGEETVEFAKVVTRCILNSCTVQEDRQQGSLIFKIDVTGFFDCAVDIFDGNGTQIADKEPVTTGGVRVFVPFRSGRYNVVVYEWDEDEDDFGFSDYRKIEERMVIYKNEQDVQGKVLCVTGIQKVRADSIFAPEVFSLHYPLLVSDLREDKAQFVGVSEGKRISIQPVDSIQSGKAYLRFYDDEDEDWMDYLFDSMTRCIVTQEQDGIPFAQARKRYTMLSDDEWVFVTKLQQQKWTK